MVDAETACPVTTKAARCPAFADAPVQSDRGQGWRYFQQAGDVLQDEAGTFYLVSRDAVQQALQHPDVFSSKRGYDAMAGYGPGVPQVPLQIDPPQHADYRRILSPHFAPRVIRQMDESLRRQANTLIDAFADRGECDYVKEFAALFPTQVFLTMFGLPLEDRDQLMRWVDTLNRIAGFTGETNEELLAAQSGLRGYILDFIARKRETPGDDLFSEILAIEGEDAWSDDELLGFGYLFAIAGLDTVTATLGHVMNYFATHPEDRAKLDADTQTTELIIEEVIRLEAVAPAVPRMTTTDVEVCGTHIPAGSLVLMLVGAANRDPRWRENPDHLSLEHASNGHLTFGGGPHRCLGSHLARRELLISVQEFHRRIPQYSTAPGYRAEVKWPASILALETLPLVFPVEAASR